MKTKINLGKRDYKIIGITLFAGLLFGWLLFHGSNNENVGLQTAGEHAHEEQTIWTCSMHPQIRMDKPGKCPICGMDLIPLQETSGSDLAISPDEIRMTETAVKIADIQTMTIGKAYPDKEVYLLGKIKPDERNIAELTARFGGRIEKLYVNFTGQNVSKGEKLATIYSPSLVTAQKELLEAMEYREKNPDFYKAARNKLKLWDLTDEQIDNIELKGEARNYFDVLSPTGGTVTRRNVALGDYVKEGSALFQVIDLTRVWVMFEAYERDLPWIKPGDKVDFTIQSLPGRYFSGHVSFIDPLIDPKTRIARVRVEVQNKGLVLKPEMFANGILTSSVAGNKKDLLIPKTAVLWTGKRAVVYVKVPEREQPSFKYREIILGPVAGDFYIVNRGLKEGEEIAVNGVFRIDAAAQLAGKPSMMNPAGGIISTGHNHTDIDADSKELVHNLVNKVPARIKEESEIDNKFKNRLTDIYNAYLEMKNAFIASDAKQAGQKANLVEESLKAVNMGLLTEESHMEWMKYLDQLENTLRKINSSPDIASQRKAFAEFNLVFYEVIKEFGLAGGIVYYQYCPMADGEKGAYWFSELKEIQNPYFGEAMLKCGETRETFKY
jgi:Cu(I)/Ag(I) efflux system membrane fusion protein